MECSVLKASWSSEINHFFLHLLVHTSSISMEQYLCKYGFDNK